MSFHREIAYRRFTGNFKRSQLRGNQSDLKKPICGLLWLSSASSFLLPEQAIEKINCRSDSGFQLVGLWLANETTFAETKDKFQVVVKDIDLYLTPLNYWEMFFSCID